MFVANETDVVLLQVEDEADDDNGQKQQAPRIVSLASLDHEGQRLSVEMPGFLQCLSELFHVLL